MECAKSVELLSDFHDGLLGEEERVLVQTHLAECPPCAGIFRDLDVIVISASVLREEQGISFADENLLWQRMNIAKRAVH